MGEPASHLVPTSPSARFAAPSAGGFSAEAVTPATVPVTSPGSSTSPGTSRRTDVPDTTASISPAACVRTWNCGLPPPSAGRVKSTVRVCGSSDRVTSSPPTSRLPLYTFRKTLPRPVSVTSPRIGVARSRSGIGTWIHVSPADVIVQRTAAGSPSVGSTVPGTDPTPFWNGPSQPSSDVGAPSRSSPAGVLGERSRIVVPTTPETLGPLVVCSGSLSQSGCGSSGSSDVA